MKAKCSFILKALTALVLAVLMLFGTMVSGLSAIVEIAETGWNIYVPAGTVYYDFTDVGISASQQYDSSKRGANYFNGSNNNWTQGYSSTAGGTVISQNFASAISSTTSSASFIKTDVGGWADITGKTYTSGYDVASVYDDGSGFNWMKRITFSEDTVLYFNFNTWWNNTTSYHYLQLTKTSSSYKVNVPLYKLSSYTSNNAAALTNAASGSNGEVYFATVPAGTYFKCRLLRQKSANASTISSSNTYNITGGFQITTGAYNTYGSASAVSSDSDGAGKSWTWSDHASTASLTTNANDPVINDEITLTPSINNTRLNSLDSTSYTVTLDGSTATSGTDYTIDGNTFIPKKAGTYSITATATYHAKGFTSKTATATSSEQVIEVGSGNLPNIDTFTIGGDDSATLNVGGTATLANTTSNADGYTVYYESSDPTVASISSGTVTAVKPGTATITAKLSNDGGTTVADSATVSVTVNAPTISFSNFTTQVNRTGTFGATISANAPAVAGTFSYSIVSGSSYISLSGTNNANWTATAAGSPKIRATYTYRNGTDTANLTVTKDITVTISSPTIQVKYNTGGGGATTTQSMTYNAAATTTVGGTADHLVYKYTLANPTKNTKYYAAITIDGTEYHLASSSYTASVPLTGSGSAAMTTSGSNWIIFTTKNQSASSSGNYNLYFDYVTKKFYIEYPVQITYDGRCNGTSVKKEYVMIDYGATPSTNRTLSKPTGYTQTSATAWYTDTGCTTSYTAAARTSDLTIYTPFTADQYTVTLDAGTNGGTIKKTAGDTAAGTMTFTHTYGTAETLASQYNTIIPPTGYTLKGWYTTADGSTSATTVAANQNSDITYYAQYSVITGGAVAKAYTDGAPSATGGTVKIGDSGSAGDSKNLTSISIVSNNKVIATKAAGYSFDGWTFSGDNRTHLMYSFDGSSYTAVPATGKVGTSSDTAIYIKTDGTAGLTTENAEVRAMFINVPYSVSVVQKKYDSADPTTANVATITGASNSVVYNTSVTLEATSIASGYEFVGWYVAGAADNAAPVSTANPYTFTCTDNTPLEARFRKVYYLTFYKTWEQSSSTGKFTYKTAPPKKVTITDAQGEVWAVYTYAESTSSVSEAVTRTATGEYNEGDKLKVLAGYSIDAKYSALASSDVIRGAFYNNDIRYTTSNQADNLYLARNEQTTGFHEADADHPHGYYNSGDDDWGTSDSPYTYTVDTTIYADEDYYIGTAFYTAVHTNSSSYKGSISQSAHTVSWTAESDYLNIDIELADKKKFVFSDYDNIVITCDNTDEYFAIGETVTDHLSIKAAGNAGQTNTITLANVKFYYYDAINNTYTDASGNAVTAENRVEIPQNTITASLASGTTSVNSGTTAGNTISFSGTMIATDIYVELDLKVTYKLYIGSKIVSDVMENKTYLAEVATVTATPSTTGQSAKTAPNNALYNSSANTIGKGDSVTYTVAFSGGWNKYYMFNGWYKGTASGPDYSAGALSTKTTFTYKPSAGTYIYAVGTRDLFINGSKYLFGGTDDWKNKNGESKNFKMEFDPDYTSSHGQGRYVYEITPTMFASASNTYYVGNTYNSANEYYNDNNKMGNSSFKIYDVEEDQDHLSFWTEIQKFQQVNSDLTYGKIYYRDGSDQAKNGNGYIAFTTNSNYSNNEYWSSYHEGYDAPIYIFAYPDKTFSVQASYVYPHIYVSNGFNGIDTTTTSNVSIKVNNGTARSNNATNDSSFTNNMKFNGAGWSPKDGSNYNVEGHVSDITIGAKDATVTLSKTVDSDTYEVSSFIVYDLFNDSVKSYVPTASGTTYTVSIKMQTGHNLYIVPIIEVKAANMKVVVDATQLNKTQWGDLVGCYAWYTDGTHAYGAYPGQLMIPSDDGLTLSANFPATHNGAHLSGITFSNYLDGEKTWLGCTNVLGTVTTQGSEGSGNIIPTYNLITLGNSEYHRTNFKAQTYDYREPVAFYENRDVNAQSFLLNYALKDGNSNIISWDHSDLTGNNIKTYKQAHPSWDDVNFEYLTTADGDTYADMNGVAIDHKPTASFYVVAKGQVIYKNSALDKVFGAGKTYQSPTGITYPNVGSAAGANVTQNYAVQWYVYDANGDFITTMLSAGYADKTTIGGTTSLIGQALLDAGYAIDGRAVAICYDKPRYCYSEKNSIPNTGDSFNAYRFTGQWLQQSAYTTAKVYGEVGMMTDNGEELAGSSNAAYGSVTVSVDKSKLNYASYGKTGTENGINYGEACIADGDKQAITLTASSMNFAGWYYYNADGDLVKLTEKEEISITPTFSKDVTYYAMYEARATYSYLYQGREGAKSYSVDGGELSEDEMSSSPANTVSKTARTDFGTKTPGANAVSIYKKTITWNNSVEQSMLDNSTAYTMKISNATVTDAKFNLTYHFTTAAGANANYIGNVENVTFNNVVDLVNTKSLNLNSYAASGKVFKGWYECDSSGAIVNDARPLSTQWNFGQVIVKNTHILAVFGNSYYSGNDTWEVYIDDQEVTREMYTATSGNYYNDVIICARQNKSTLTTLPSGAKVGALFVDDNGTGKVIDTEKLSVFANALSASSGKSGKSNGCTVTNMFTDNVTTFGRVDLAVRADYASTVNHNYYVYAYVLINGTYYFDTTNAYKTGTYE